MRGARIRSVLLSKQLRLVTLMSVSVMAYYSPPMAVLPYLTRQLSILAFAVLALYLLIRWRGVEHVIERFLVD